MNERNGETASNPAADAAIADGFANLRAALARCRDASERSTLSLLRLAAGGILEAREQPPAERHMGRVRWSYDHLIELRERMAHDPTLATAETLADPLLCVPELIDMGREMLGEHPQP